MPHSLKFCPITSTFLCGPATFEKAYEKSITWVPVQGVRLQE